MEKHVCPWWLGYLLVNPLRRWLHHPRKVVGPYVREGMTVLEPGPGMGYFTLELARLVGESGRVVAVDLQPRMLAALRRRADRKGVASRIDSRLVVGDGMGIADLAGRIDFLLAFAVVHELPDVERFFAEARGALKGTGKLLIAEPRGHVSQKDFAHTLEAAGSAGFVLEDTPPISRSWTALLAPAAN